MDRANKKTFKYWYILVEYAVVVTTLITLNQGMSSFRPVAYVITILLALLLPHKELTILVILLIPLADIMKFNSDSYSVLPIIICVYIGKRLLTEQKYSKYFLLLYSILLLMSLINSIFRYNSLTSPLPFFIYLLFTYLAIKNYCGEIIFNRAAIVYLLSSILVIVGSQLFTTAAMTIGSYTEYMVRSVGFSTAWGFGQIMLVASAFAAVLYKKKVINLIVMMSLISFFSYFALQSGTFSIALGLFVILIYVISVLGNKIKLKLLPVIISPLVFYLTYNIVLQPMIVLRAGISDNGRFEIWTSYLQIFTNNVDIMLFGVGGGCIPNFAVKVGLLTTHNIILETIVQFGIIGSLILFAIIYYLFKNSILRPSQNENILPLYVLLTFLLTQGGSGNETLFVLLILSFVNKFDINKSILYSKKDEYYGSNCHNNFELTG